MKPLKPLSLVIDWIHRHRPANPGRYVMPYLVFAITALLAVNLWQTGEVRDAASQAQQVAELSQRLGRQNHRLTVALRSGLVQNCQKNGNPLRIGFQELLRREIERTRSTPARFFPEIPPPVFHRLIREQVKATRETLKKIAPIDCVKQFRGVSLRFPAR